MKLLRIDSSARRNSVSRQLTQKFVEIWKKENPSGEVIERDLATTSLPLITDEWTHAAFSDSSHLTPAQRETLSVSDTLIEELLAADTIVLGAPMYNLTVSAPLKGWIDQIVRIGRTFLYDAAGPQGVLKDRKVIVLTSRGGAFRPGTPTAQFDHQEPYLRHILGFIGLTDVTFIHAENQKPGDLAEPARAAAIEQLRLAATAVNQSGI
ncbi:MAG TPA: NAD(P)H-dependent oxidoreductase [Candidatus Sulfotelmatobacter sp.]|nr:NAD(P)H-dependent oxidoreductase [Candidatus Sulfotelmatobacter sp.]